MTISLTPVQRAQAPNAAGEPPYRWFLAASLALAVGGGFAIALVLPLARLFEWDWGSRWPAMAQAHGQLQLLGFSGLFTAGMSLRLMPRFGGRPLAFRQLVPSIVVLIGGSLVVRTIAQPLAGGGVRDVALVSSGILLLGGAVSFAIVVFGTLAHRRSTAEATGYFFCAGSIGLLVASVLNLDIVIQMAREDLALAPFDKQSTLVFIEQFGFTVFFVSGVACRAVPTFTGRARPDLAARAAALALAAGVGMFAFALAWNAYEGRSTGLLRAGDMGLVLVACAFALIVWLTGVFHPSANRVAAASQAQFWFVRAALGWMLIAGVIIAWLALRALAEDRAPDAFALDAIRHTLAIGLLTMMIVGMGMLIVPEFAGRRLQHPGEQPIVLAMAVALNAAVALRIWPALEGAGWIADTRNVPIAVAGVLAEAVVLIFAAMFAQSYAEQRTPGWGRRASP